MKKLNKKLQLNKQVVANLNDLFGGEPMKTWNCVSEHCTSNQCPTLFSSECNPNSENIKGETCAWTTDFTCTPSNAGCTTVNACSQVWC